VLERASEADKEKKLEVQPWGPKLQASKKWLITIKGKWVNSTALTIHLMFE
jgi:hypothetical protein